MNHQEVDVKELPEIKETVVSNQVLTKAGRGTNTIK